MTYVRIGRKTTSQRRALPVGKGGLNPGPIRTHCRQQTARSAPRRVGPVIRGLVVGFLAIVFAAVGGAAVANGQPSGPRVPPAEGANGDGRALPDTFYLRDEGGALQPVLDMSFEDFRKLWELQRSLQTPQQPPGHIITALELEATADHSHWATLSGVATIEMLGGGWQRAPLGMSSVALSEETGLQTNTAGASGFQLAFEEDTGHVAWIQGRAGAVLALKLAGKAPLTEEKGVTRLAVNLPAAAAGRLTLTLPPDCGALRVGEGATLISNERRGDKRRVAVIEGARGKFSCSWERSAAAADDRQPAFEVAGRLVARASGQDTVQTDAEFTIQPVGGPLDSVAILLPPTAKLLRVESDREILSRARSVKPSKSSHESDGNADRRLDPRRDPHTRVDLALAEPSEEAFRVNLSVAQLSPRGASVNVARFEFPGATAHTGQIVLATSNETLVDWTLGDGVQRTETTVPGVANDTAIAEFEYYMQPATLIVRTLPNETRIRGRSQSRVRVTGARMELDASLDFDVRGAKTYEVRAALPGWTIDEVGPPGVVNSDGLLLEQTDPLTIPLAEAVTGSIRLQVRGHRDIPEAAETIEIPAPQTLAEGAGSTTLIVETASDIRLSPIMERSSGVQLETANGGALRETPATAGQRLVFRAQDGGEACRLVAELIHAKRELSESSFASIEIDEDATFVRQEMEITVAHAPLAEIVLRGPAGLADEPRMTIEGQPVVAFPAGEEPPAPESPVSAGAEQPSSTRRRRYRVALPEARLGTFLLVVEWVAPHEPLVVQTRAAGGALAIAEVPISLFELAGNVSEGPERPGASAVRRLTRDSIVMLSDGYLARINSPAVSLIEPAGPLAELVPSVSDRKAHGLRFDPSGRSRRFVLELQRQVGDRGAIVQRQWTQVWLSRTERRDRWCARLRTSEPTIHVTLPPGVEPRSLQALINGRPAAARSLDTGTVAIDVSPAARSAESLVVELCYSFESPRDPAGRVAFVTPRIDATPSTHRCYFTLILPADEHLVIGSGELAEESAWRWSGWGWRRLPTLSDAALETWIGASHQRGAARSANRYLYSTFGPLGTVSAVTAQRHWLVLPASLAALICGMLLIYVPLLRRPLTLLALAVALGAVGVTYPEPVMILAQAAALGVALVVVAMWLEWFIVRRRLAPAVVRGATGGGEPRSTRNASAGAGGAGSGTSLTVSRVLTADNGE